MDFLKGKKTYIVALLVAGVVFASQMGWLSADQADMLFGLLGATGLATLRMGVG